MNDDKFLVDNSVSSNDLSVMKTPKTYIWKPKEDISVYELALCLPLISFRGWFDAEYAISELPENCQRHFEEVKEG